MHQSLYHVVADARWSDEAVLDGCLDFLLPPPARQNSTGRPRELLQRDAQHRPVSPVVSMRRRHSHSGKTRMKSLLHYLRPNHLLSTSPTDTAMVKLVHLGKHGCIIERDYKELKQELGLGHYEGRGWRGFHHHATLCISPPMGSWRPDGIVFPVSTHPQSWIIGPPKTTGLPAVVRAFVPSGTVQVRLQR
jgi:SRSO17 transposase